MTLRDQEEQGQKIEQMVADIENKKADTAYKQGMLRWEPWKAMAVAAGAGATLMLAAVAIVHAWVGR